MNNVLTEIINNKEEGPVESNLEKMMKRVGINSFTDLVELTGFTRHTIYRYRTQEGIRTAAVESALRLTEVLGCKIEDLLSDEGTVSEGENKEEERFKTIKFPKLNKLTPTLESTALKISEENGELARAIGKFRGMSGENESHRMTKQEAFEEVSKELLDVAQTATTMMFLLEEEEGIDFDIYLAKHVNKLKMKGYMEK